ncbi:MAG: hypothetical protein ACYSU0_04190 [Planctomycetota bacterium]|jgi:hypothetical protein
MAYGQTPKWLIAGFVAASVAAVVFLILMIVGFSRSPEAAARARVERAEKNLQDELGSHDKTKKKLFDETDARKKAEKKAKAAEAELAAKTAKLEETVAERDSWSTKFNELKAAKDEKAKIEERARAAYESIIKSADGAKDLQARLDTLQSRRDASRADLVETPYMRRLEAEISRVKGALAKHTRAVEDKAKRDAKEAYADAVRKLKTAKGYDGEMAVLRGAREELAGTLYEAKIDSEIKSREDEQRKKLAKSVYEEVIKKVKSSPKAYAENLAALEEAAQKTEGTKYGEKLTREVEDRRKTLGINVARVVYDEVMKKLKESPKAYEENLAALEEAAGKTEGTKYGEKLAREVKDRRKTLAKDIAEAAYDGLRDRIKKNKKDYEGNITAAEAALEKAKGTKLEKKVQGILDDQKKDKLAYIGKDAYEKAVARVKTSKDRDGNIALLEELKTTAAGSKYEAGIEKLLVKQRKYRDAGK